MSKIAGAKIFIFVIISQHLIPAPADARLGLPDCRSRPKAQRQVAKSDGGMAQNHLSIVVPPTPGYLTRNSAAPGGPLQSPMSDCVLLIHNSIGASDVAQTMPCPAA